MSKHNKKKNKNKTNNVLEAKNIWASTACHKPTEIIPNLYLCKERQVKDLVKEKKIDVLVPLAELDGEIWNTGFCGEVLYYPIEDYGVLPQSILKRCVTDIISRLKAKKVAIFCLGGHGRTGYVAACVLGKLGYDDPIRTVRNKYCKSAIECNEQVESIATFLNKPHLKETYHMANYGYRYGGYGGYGYGGYGYGSLYNDYINIPYQPYQISSFTTSTKEEGVESEHIITKAGFPEYTARKWYEEDMSASGEEVESWDELDVNSRQKMYDFYYAVAIGDC